MLVPSLAVIIRCERSEKSFQSTTSKLKAAVVTSTGLSEIPLSMFTAAKMPLSEGVAVFHQRQDLIVSWSPFPESRERQYLDGDQKFPLLGPYAVTVKPFQLSGAVELPIGFKSTAVLKSSSVAMVPEPMDFKNSC